MYMCVYIDMFIYVSISINIYICCRFNRKTENGSYPFANGLNGLNGLDHRCTGESSFLKYRSEFPVCQREYPMQHTVLRADTRKYIVQEWAGA